MNEDDINNIDPKIQELLSKYEGSREKLDEYVKSIEEVQNKFMSLIPSDINYKNKYILEEKIKMMSSFYSTLLNVRQEINKTITSEIEIRRKIANQESGSEEESDIRSFADAVDKELKSRVKEQDHDDKDQSGDAKLVSQKDVAV